jgi:hypothetical protein
MLEHVAEMDRSVRVRQGARYHYFFSDLSHSLRSFLLIEKTGLDGNSCPGGRKHKGGLASTVPTSDMIVVLPLNPATEKITRSGDDSTIPDITFT